MKVMDDNVRILSETLVKLKKKTEAETDIVAIKADLDQIKLILEDLNPAKIVTFDKLYKLVDERVKQLLSK
jgi:hypothetical protein